MPGNPPSMGTAQLEWPPAVGKYGPLGGFGPTLLGCVWMMFFLCTLTIGLRIFTRYYCQKWAGWALFWTILSWVVGLIAQILLTVSIGRSLNGFSDSWMVSNALMLLWISIFLTFIAIGLSKFCIVAFLLAIQGLTHRRERYILYFLAASNMVIDAAFVFFMAFHCDPPYDMWVLGREASCQGKFTIARNFGFFTGSWNAATDLALALYPLWLLRTVQIAPNVKRGLIAVMSLGIISTICAAVKTWEMRWVDSTAMFDVNSFCLTIWTYTEMWVVLITASIPPLWPLARRWSSTFRGYIGHAKSWVSSSHSRSSSGYNADRAREQKLLAAKPGLPISLSVAERPGIPISLSVAEGASCFDTEMQSPVRRAQQAAASTFYSHSQTWPEEAEAPSPPTQSWAARMTSPMRSRMASPIRSRSRSASRTRHHQRSASSADHHYSGSAEHSHTGSRDGRIMVTTELSVHHEAISPEDLEEDLDVRAGWARRVARETEPGGRV